MSKTPIKRDRDASLQAQKGYTGWGATEIVPCPEIGLFVVVVFMDHKVAGYL